MLTQSAVSSKSSELVTKDSITLTINSRRFKFSVGDGRAAAAQLAHLIRVGLLAMALAHMALQSSAYAQEKSALTDSAGTTSWAVLHVLGFEDAKRNAKGNLTVQSAALQFGAGRPRRK